MTALEALKEFLSLEQEYKFYDYKIGSIKLWNLYRTFYRYKYVSNMTSVKSISNIIPRSKRFKCLLKNSYYSFIRIFILLFRHPQINNVIFANGRMLFKDGKYYDKFTDPVIDQSDLSESSLLFQLPLVNDYYSNRRHKEMTVPMDFFYLMSYFFIPLFFIPHLLFGNFSTIYRLYKSVKHIVTLTNRDLLMMNLWFLKTRFMAMTYSFLFDYLGVKRVLGVARQSFCDAIIGAHNNQIPVYEFQHGVTHGETEYYSGPQCPILDPDFFLAFGEMWNGNQFGIEPTKIINIGWAYKNEIVENGNKPIPDSVLFISSPDITFNILKTAKGLSEKYSQYRFFIRCHPYEKYTEEQMMVINDSNNLFLDDNSIDSQIALCRYQYIIGENSSVVYEALSLGKRVGRLCYNGINSSRFSGMQDDGFIYLYKDEDFIKLVNSQGKHIDNKAYSDFKPEIINSILNN